MTNEQSPPQRYGVFGSNGEPQGFYSDDIYPPQPNGDRNAAIPAAAIEITEVQYQQLLNDQGARFIDGEVVMPIKVAPIGTSQYDWGSKFVEIIGSY